MKKVNHHRNGGKEDSKVEEYNRLVMLNGEISDELVGDAIQEILEINDEDDRQCAKNKNYVRKPIRLVINSMGGSIYDGLALIDVIDCSMTPVHTICYGSAMSMAMIILVCGHERFAGKYATIMYHEGGYSMYHSKVQTHKEEMREVERVELLCDEILLKRTSLKKRDLTAAKNKKLDWYIPAEDALAHGIVDAIL